MANPLSRAPITNTGRRRAHRSIAAKINAMGQSRIGALLLLIATAAAIVWANVSTARTSVSGRRTSASASGIFHLEFTLHALVNDALMAIFFFTVGLEVRREFAIGELTNWSRAMVPVIAAIAGLAVPAARLLAGRGAGRLWAAWGVVISTDTAFLVGALALVGPRAPGRLRVFLLALAVVDDIGALAIIALVYTENFTPMPLHHRCGRARRCLLHAIPPQRAGARLRDAGGHRVVRLPRIRRPPTLAGVAVALLVPVYRPNRRDGRARTRARPHLPASLRTPSTPGPQPTACASRSRSTSGSSRRTRRTSPT